MFDYVLIVLKLTSLDTYIVLELLVYIKAGGTVLCILSSCCFAFVKSNSTSKKCGDITNSYFPCFSFSILWPTQNVQKGDECTRDFLFGIGEDKQRSARLSAWYHTPENYFIQVLSSLSILNYDSLLWAI